MSAASEIIHAVIFRLSGEEFAVEVQSVREVVRLGEIVPLPQSPESMEGIIDLRGHIVAIMDLHSRLGMPIPDKTDKSRIMIVRSNRMIVGLIVDAVQEVIKIPRQLLHQTPAMITSPINDRYVSGVVRWNDRIIVLLNLEALLTPKETEFLKTIRSTLSKKETQNPTDRRSSANEP